MIIINLKNIQSISDATFELGEHSITEFVGNNSNGKSILAKAIQYVTNGNIRHKDARRSLIKDGTKTGIITFIKDTSQLSIILEEELNACYIAYFPNFEEKPDSLIKRPLSDAEVCNKLLTKFGFRVYAKGDICLQLSPTFGAIPFITTSGAVNKEIQDDIITDKVAQEFLDSFSTITYPALRTRLRQLRQEREYTQTVLDNIENVDWRFYEGKLNEIKELYEVIKDYSYVEVNDIDIPPCGFDLLDTVLIKEIPVPVAYELAPNISVIQSELSQLITALDGVCPTCGRRYVD